MQSMQLYLEQDLAEMVGKSSDNSQSSLVALASLKASAINPWMIDQSLKAIWDDPIRSTQVVDTLIAKLLDMAAKDSHRHHRRATYVVDFLRDNQALVAHTKTEIPFRTFVDTLQHIMTQASQGWHIVKNFASPSHHRALCMTGAELVSSWNPASVNARAVNRHDDRKRKPDQLVGPAFPSPSGSRSDHRTPKPGARGATPKSKAPAPSGEKRRPLPILALTAVYTTAWIWPISQIGCAHF